MIVDYQKLIYYIFRLMKDFFYSFTIRDFFYLFVMETSFYSFVMETSFYSSIFSAYYSIIFSGFQHGEWVSVVDFANPFCHQISVVCDWINGILWINAAVRAQQMYIPLARFVEVLQKVQRQSKRRLKQIIELFSLLSKLWYVQICELYLALFFMEDSRFIEKLDSLWFFLCLALLVQTIAIL